MPTTIFCAGTTLRYLAQVLHEPVLRRDRPRRRRQPVLVVIHQDNGVGLPAEKRVIVFIVARWQGNHQLQSRRVQRRRQLADEFAEIRLALQRHFFEVHHDPGLVRLARHIPPHR